MKKYKRYYITWRIAIRKRQEGIFENGEEFVLLKNPNNGWLADPFLFEYNSVTYIFAERWDYKKQKGIICYSEYKEDANNIRWVDIIEEDWHISYPFIWNDRNGIHILPEASGSKQLYYYTAEDFPRKWKKDQWICSGSFADSTLLINDSGCYIYTHSLEGNKGRLYRSSFDVMYPDNVDWIYTSDDARYSRPAGNFIYDGDKIYRVAQDCSNSYGENIVILRINDDVTGYIEMIEKTVGYNEINVKEKRGLIGCHTYNRSEKYEVIDLRYYAFNYKDFISSEIRRLKNV